MPKAYLIGGSKSQDDQTKREISKVSNEPRRVTVISSTKVCKRCMIFCMETKAFFRAGEALAYTREMSKRAGHAVFPKVKVWCKNGCHEKFRDWGWTDIGDPCFQGKHLPSR